MWYLMLKSGVHATIAGVLLAFVIPFPAKAGDEASPSHFLEHFLHCPDSYNKGIQDQSSFPQPSHLGFRFSQRPSRKR